MPTDPITLSLIAIIAGYIFGSIPFGLVLTRLAGYGDIRKIGSGNIGATNVLRTGNKPLALATLLLDSGKGAIITILFSHFTQATPTLVTLCALSAIIGHCYPVWLNFQGGKGVATTLGTILAASPLSGLITCLVWLATALITRISSLSALVAIASTPISSYIITNNIPASALTFAITALVFFRHIDNIKRILKGTEPKIGEKKKEGKTSDQSISDKEETSQ